MQSEADQNRQVPAYPVNLFHTVPSNLPDFSTLSAESGRYCLPFFSLSRSDSNQTLRCIVPLLPQLLVDSGSEGSAYIALFSLAMGRLTGGGSAGQGFFTGTQRSGDKAPSIVTDYCYSCTIAVEERNQNFGVSGRVRRRPQRLEILLRLWATELTMDNINSILN